MSSVWLQFRHWWSGSSLPQKVGFWVAAIGFPSTVIGAFGYLTPIYHWVFPRAAPLPLELVNIDIKAGNFPELGKSSVINGLQFHLTIHNPNEFPLVIALGEENSVLDGVSNLQAYRGGNTVTIPYGVDVDAPLSPIKIGCENGTVLNGRFVAEVKYGFDKEHLDKRIVAKGDVEVTCIDKRIKATWEPDGDSVAPTGLKRGYKVRYRVIPLPSTQ